MSRALRLGALALPLLLVAACAGEDTITFELPGEPAGEDAGGPARLLTGPPRLRSPFAGSERVTSHVSHGGVNHACDPHGRRGHKGTDFGVPVGTPVYAAAAGTVLRSVDGCNVGHSACGGRFGNHVILLHEGGRATLYAHLSRGSGLPRVGSRVDCGARIGASGNTGSSTGPHLHFEVRDGVRDVGSYYAAPPLDPWGGGCSSQPAHLWMDSSPGPTCDGEEAAPRDDAQVVDATHPREIDARPGERVTQRWVIENTGTTTWSRAEGYALRFVGGEDFGQPEPMALPVAEVAPSSRVTFELAAVVPMTAGAARGEWRMAKGIVGVFGATASLSVRGSEAAAEPAGCDSATLGREVPDGACVQVDYPSCGAGSCAWYMCRDSAWMCADVAACAGERFGNEACPSAACDENATCGGCTTTPGCAWCADEGRCVPEGSASCGSASGDPEVCEGCHEEGRVCEIDADCCGAEDGGTTRCLLGFCTDVSSCGNVGAGCGGPGDCCGLISCREDRAGESLCCLRDTDPCTDDSDCCGDMTCGEDSRCACQPVGESCVTHGDCCGGAICVEGTCGF